MSTTKTATFVKDRNGTGVGKVYRCTPPMRIHDTWCNSLWEDTTCLPQCGHAEYVWVSAASVLVSGPETYIFPSDEDGNVTDWGELTGSFKGGLDHEEALRRAGYEVA